MLHWGAMLSRPNLQNRHATFITAKACGLCKPCMLSRLFCTVADQPSLRESMAPISILNERAAHAVSGFCSRLLRARLLFESKHLLLHLKLRVDDVVFAFRLPRLTIAGRRRRSLSGPAA